MKRTVTALLVAAILAISQEQPRAQMAGAVLVVITAVIAASVIVWVYASDGSTKKRAIVLYKGYLDGSWTAVATNVMVIGPNLTKAFPAFRDDMKDETAFYKVREIAMVPQLKPGFASGVTARPYIY